MKGNTNTTDLRVAEIEEDVSALETDVANMEKNTIVDQTNILGYTSSNKFTCPSDGYVFVNSTAHTGNVVYMYIAEQFVFGGALAVQSLFVRKGTTVYVSTNTGSDNVARFYRLG